MITIFFTKKQRNRKATNYTSWTLTLYKVENNEPTFLEEIKTDYSSHEQNILEHFAAEQGKNYQDLRAQYKIFEI